MGVWGEQQADEVSSVTSGRKAEDWGDRIGGGSL